MARDPVLRRLQGFFWLGCSREEFRRHIEALWEPGMTWDNYGRGLKGWQIDHIRPKSSVDLRNEAAYRELCHYTNLRPVWAMVNFKKGTGERYAPRSLSAGESV